MAPADKLKQDHEAIERELFELETIQQDEVINYSNLVHVLKKIDAIWSIHEEKETKFFKLLDKKGFKIPGKNKFTLEHKDLKKHRIALQKALDSGSEIQTKEALNTDGKMLIEKLRKHMEEEDNVLYTSQLPELNSKEIISIGFK